MANLELWGYGESFERIADGRWRDVRWFGKCYISHFIRIVMQYGNQDNASDKWIRDRMCPTKNDQELLLSHLTEYKYLLCRDTKTGDIVKAIDLKTYTELNANG